MIPKNTICLWYDKDAEAAARFYAATFPDSRVTAVHRAPGDFPGGKQDDVRRFAAEHGTAPEQAIALGMEEKAREFREAGGEIYVPEIAKS